MQWNDRITEMLRHRGMTQRELAAAMGVTQSAVTKWVSAANVPNLVTAARLARVLGTRLDWLAWGEGAPETPSEEDQMVLDVARKLGHRESMQVLVAALTRPAAEIKDDPPPPPDRRRRPR